MECINHRTHFILTFLECKGEDLNYGTYGQFQGRTEITLSISSFSETLSLFECSDFWVKISFASHIHFLFYHVS